MSTESEFSSKLIWATTALAESGLSFSRQRLDGLDAFCAARCDRCATIARGHGLPLTKDGALKELRKLIERAIEQYPAISEHSIFSLTKTHLIPTSRLQRLLVQEHLPPKSRLRRLLSLVNHHHAARDVRSRYTSKLGAAGLPWLGHAIIVYSHWHPTPSPYKESAGGEGGAVSRLSASDPPIQQLPAEIKACICSRYPAGSIIAVDASQIELRCGAIHSGDPFLLSAFRDGRDLHADLAVKVYGDACRANPHWLSGDNRRDPRQPGKTIRFQTFYGGGAAMAQEKLLVRGGLLMPLEDVQTIVETVREEEAVWFGWAGEWVREHRDHGVVRLPITGQVRHLDLKNPEQTKRLSAEREAVNFPIQCQANNTMVSIAYRLAQTLPPTVYFSNFTHDELLFDCPPEISISEMRERIHDAFVEEQESGHWARLQDHYGHTCPLEYGIKSW
jgi:hypothetical protein